MDAPPRRRWRFIFPILVTVLGNSQFWSVVGRLGDIDFLVSKWSLIKGPAMTLVELFKNWGFVAGLAWIFLLWWRDVKQGEPSMSAAKLNGADASRPAPEAAAQVEWSAQQDRMAAQLVETANRASALNADLLLEQQAHKKTRRDWAEQDLREFANMKWPGGETPSVVVRFFGYDRDHDIAQRIRGIVETFLGWPVVLDGSNKPTLPKASTHKVVFVSGATGSFRHVAVAFERGQLAGEGISIGVRNFDDTLGVHTLEIHVLPDGMST